MSNLETLPIHLHAALLDSTLRPNKLLSIYSMEKQLVHAIITEPTVSAFSDLLPVAAPAKVNEVKE